jgi:hypothetical protein
MHASVANGFRTLRFHNEQVRKVKINENSQMGVAALVASVEKDQQDQQDGLCPIPHFNHWLHIKQG